LHDKEKPKKLKFGLLKFYRFLERPKNLGFLKPFFEPCYAREKDMLLVIARSGEPSLANVPVATEGTESKYYRRAMRLRPDL